MVPLRVVHILLAVALLTGVGRALTGDVASKELLGTGRGIDHVTVLAQRLATTSVVFTDQLGFTVTPRGDQGNGFESSTIYFGDRTYLELYGIRDRTLIAKGEQAHVLEAPDGITWLNLNASSADAAITHLKARGFQPFGPFRFPEPEEGKAEPTPWYFKLGGIADSAVPGRDVYFIEYNEPLIEESRRKDPAATVRRQTHANGAEGIHSVWIGVKDLDEAMKTYERMGFERGRMLKFAAVNATARELPAGRGTILLVQPANTGSPASAWLGDRPHRLMGLSIKVKNVAIAGELLAARHRLSTRPYQGLYGKSILVSPTAAGGVWIELFE
jgi:catechol 2,3-dioxygenase-like lactoylglutathione lyase family enzyme